MNAENKKFFRDLLNVCAPSGHEQPAQKIYREFVEPYCDEVQNDVNGNCIAIKKGKGKRKLLISGHADEIGLMVSYIDDDGRIYFQSLGGPDLSVLNTSRVVILHGEKKIHGVICRPHYFFKKGADREKIPSLDQHWIEIGAKDKKEVEKLVSIGDVATFEPNYTALRNNTILSKATDDRTGVYVAAAVLKELAGEEIDVNLYCVASVQEETGLRGARTSAYGINPEIGLAVDVTFDSTTPGMEKKKMGEVKIGDGPVIAVGSSINPRVYGMLKDAADKAKIKYQIEPASSYTGTDIDIIQLTRAGVATGLISIPCRYMHSPSEMVSLKDLDEAAKLIAEFVRNINDDTNLIP